MEDNYPDALWSRWFLDRTLSYFFRLKLRFRRRVREFRIAHQNRG